MNTTVSPHQIPAPRKGSRAERASMPVAADVVREAAITYGVCTRPVPMRVTDTVTGTVAFVDVPCGSTLDSRCPTCAERARRLRMHQCREGWHLEAEPILEPQPPNAEQIGLVLERADITAAHRELLEHGDDLTAAACAESMIAVDGELNRSGVRGVVDPPVRPRRVRSTRRRQDAPDLPRCPMANTTVGRAFTGRDGTVFRPSLFLTVTLDTYGRVTGEGTPLDPDTYDYVRAARDAICFSRLLDRLVQNLRRVAGYDVQYFAAVEPQRRLAPHAHFAIRGTIPRTVLKTAVAATYHQVWWPAAKEHLYDQDHRPVWAEDSDGNGNSGFVDPNTGFSLKTWEQALDELEAEDARPRHVARFGAQTDVQGLLAGSPEADRRIGYLAKYLTKSMGEAHESPSAAQREHLDRLQAVLAVEPCSPSCPNWLRYGIQPKGAR
ncbi:MAG: hypothetical protein QG608_2998, partial [Actinomycetota bacterium]|nr:hypothetical protein [Actinomycetota bacterium]